MISPSNFFSFIAGWSDLLLIHIFIIRSLICGHLHYFQIHYHYPFPPPPHPWATAHTLKIESSSFNQLHDKKYTKALEDENKAATSAAWMIPSVRTYKWLVTTHVRQNGPACVNRDIRWRPWLPNTFSLSLKEYYYFSLDRIPVDCKVHPRISSDFPEHLLVTISTTGWTKRHF